MEGESKGMCPLICGGCKNCFFHIPMMVISGLVIGSCPVLRVSQSPVLTTTLYSPGATLPGTLKDNSIKRSLSEVRVVHTCIFSGVRRTLKLGLGVLPVLPPGTSHTL